jgi:hypothetical protein
MLTKPLNIMHRILNIAGIVIPACAPVNGRAQQPAPLPPLFQQKIEVNLTGATMDAAFAAITQKTHLSIVADGAPARQKADVSLDGTVKGALDAVADAFDYTWTLTRSGVVVMAKRFKDPAERPQVNLPEMVGMTRDIIRALNIVDYDKDPSHWPVLVKEVAQSFTQQQLHVLDSGAKLHGSDLLPEQQRQLTRAILSKTFNSTLQMWEDLLPKLPPMPGSRIQARKTADAQAGAKAHPYDYLYIFRRANEQLHVIELPRVNYETNAEKLVTP